MRLAAWNGTVLYWLILCRVSENLLKLAVALLPCSIKSSSAFLLIVLGTGWILFSMTKYHFVVVRIIPLHPGKDAFTKVLTYVV